MSYKKVNSLVVIKEKVLVIWTKDQTSHNIPLSQNLIWNKILTCFSPMKGESKEQFGASRSWFMRFKEGTVSVT
jgi:hypothetical protein